MLSQKEYQNLDKFIKEKLNKSKKILDYFDLEQDVKQKESGYRLTLGRDEKILEETGVSRGIREEKYRFEIDHSQQEYTVVDRVTGVRVTFVQGRNWDLEALEMELGKLYETGPDVVLVAEKPYHEDLMRWHYLDEGDEFKLSYSDEHRFFDTGKELKEYLNVLLKDPKDFKAEQQTRIVYQNHMKTKKCHLGYSALLNILFVIGQGKLDIKTGVIGPTLNELLSYYVTNMSLDEAKTAYQVAQHRIFLDRLDYVVNTCGRYYGCIQCKPLKIKDAPSGVHSLVTDYELDRSVIYKTMSRNIARSVRSSPDGTKIRVIFDEDTNSLEAFLNYIKY